MKKQILCLIFAFGGVYLSYGQVGIGTASPNRSSQLEVVAADRGILISRVALSSTTDTSTIKNGNVSSLLVFNTATSGDITPGYYYWYDSKWLRVLNADNIPNNIVTWNNANSQFSYVDKNGTATVFDIADLVLKYETLTTAVLNASTGILVYKDEKGTENSINLGAMIPNFETLTSISQDTAAGTITYKDEKGISTVLDVKALIVQHETLTTVVFDSALGVLTYTDEKGIPNVISLKEMIPNFETLTSISQDTTVGTITYKDEKGVSTVLDVKALILQHETLTKAVFDPIVGVLTYTDEKGTSNAISLKEMVPNFETLTSISQDTLAGTITYKDEKGVSTILSTPSANVTTGSNKIVLGGTPVGAALKPFSVDVDESKLTLSKISGKVTNSQITAGTPTQILVTDMSGNSTQWVDQSTLVPATTNILSLTSNALKSNVNGVASTVNFTDTNIKSSKNITGTDIVVTGGAGSSLKEVSLAIKPGTANQILITNAAGSATEWINQSAVVPATTNTLTSTGNNLTSNVNGVSQTARLINTNSLVLDTDKKIISTVNGIAGAPLDLSAAVTANQKTSSLVNGVTTTVTSVASMGNPNNTEYKIEVNPAAVQAGQTTTSVKAATAKTIVTSMTSGSNTEYSVDVNEANLTLSNIGGKVTTAQLTNGTPNQVLVTNTSGTAAQWVNQSALVPTTTNTLTLDSDKKVVSTVNGVASSPALDLSSAVAANQKTSSLANGSNTTVISTVSGNNREYVVSTNPATTTVIGAVKPGNGLTVDSSGTLVVNAAAISTGKALFSTDLSVTSDGATALLKDVTIDIKANAVTGAKIADATITPAKIAAPSGTSKLVLGYDGLGNVSWSSVTAVAGGTTVSNSLSGTQLSTTVNGTSGTAVDLTSAIQAGQKTSSVKAATNKTAVTSTSLAGNTEYSVDVNEGNLTLSSIGGKVTTAQITNGTANQVLVTNAAGTAAQWINQSALVPATTNSLVLDAGNKLVSTVNGVTSSPALDLTTAVTTNQNTSSVVNGTNTTVTATTSGKNSQYVVNTNAATATVIGAVKPGNGLTVDATGTLAVNATAINTGKSLTSTDLSITTDGATALLKDVTIDIKANAITTAKIADGTITGADIASKTINATNLDAGAGVSGRVATADAAGVVTYSTIPSNSVVGADVTAASTKITLGGAPIGAVLKAFSVDVNEANLTLTNHIATGSANQVFVVDGSTSKAKWVDQSTLLDNTTVDNGLTKTGNNVKFGGILTGTTVITNNSNPLTFATGGSNFSVTGLPNTGASADKIMVTDAAGIVKTIAPFVAPKFFYAPSMIMPIANSNLPSYATYDSGTQVYTVDMYLVYNSQFSMSGDVSGTGRTAIKSAGSGSLDVAASDALGYFVTYFDNSVYDPASITLTADGKLRYKVLGSAVITSKTYMNVIFKIL